MKVFGIVICAYIISVLSESFLERVIRRAVVRGKGMSEEAEKKREDTLIRVINGTLRILVWLVALLMVLPEFGIAVGPLVAAAGVAGVALGFGGQYLIRDVITGLFMILENQYRVGDVVSFDGTSGLVEDITLRMTTLRDLDGTVHHIPHGEIKKVSNLSKGFARININIGVSYSADLERVERVVNAVGLELSKDEKWAPKIIKTPVFLRVEDFADSAVIIKILGDTKPLAQWDVAGELRRRLKIAFDKEGIEIPFPQRVVYMAK